MGAQKLIKSKSDDSEMPCLGRLCPIIFLAGFRCAFFRWGGVGVGFKTGFHGPPFTEHCSKITNKDAIKTNN